REQQFQPYVSRAALREDAGRSKHIDVGHTAPRRESTIGHVTLDTRFYGIGPAWPVESIIAIIKRSFKGAHYPRSGSGAFEFSLARHASRSKLTKTRLLLGLFERKTR